MMNTPLFRGTATALVTPFGLDGSFDETAFRRLIRYQLDAGIDALVVLGTTGENPTIADEERDRIVDVAVETAAGDAPVIIGTGTNDTATSVRYSRRAQNAGADGLLVVGPYYNRPSQRGFIAHVQEIATAATCPIILYNVPGRTGFRAEVDTVLQLAADVPSVVGVKEASGDLAHISNILRMRPDGFSVYSGDDELTLALLALGADGVVSVISNALPDRFGDLVRAGLAGDFDLARRIHFDLLPVQRACFAVTNPVPIKAMLSHLGMMTDRVRLPLLPLDESERARVLEPLDRLRILAA
ncbi:MAG: 4-hydroxy-tetrahydrodipicolinate synthase [Rhodothermales bacterium]